jgi:beta-glucosidase
MSGELGLYDIVEGNMGDRNDLKLWWNADGLVSSIFPFTSRFFILISGME